jgi:hypothetical protein
MAVALKMAFKRVRRNKADLQRVLRYAQRTKDCFAQLLPFSEMTQTIRRSGARLIA